MSWTPKLRWARIPAVGALTAAGVAGAALLASPIASSYADSGPPVSWGGPKGLSGTYSNGGFCYQNKPGDPNTYRLQVSEPSYDPNSATASLSFEVQKWDNASNQYRDERPAFTADIDKLKLGGSYPDANAFCASITGSRAGQYLGGDVYRFGEWTSSRTIG